MQLSARNQDGLEPGVEARLLDHDGHLTLLASRIPEVHGWLKDRM